MSQNKDIEVLVYGSLRKGLHNHGVLGDSPYVKTTTVSGFELKPYCGSFPAVVHNPNSLHPVTVEKYMVDVAGLARLDGLEGYPNFYNRMKTPLGWIYHIDSEDLSSLETITHGDWNRYLKENKEVNNGNF